MDFEKRMNEARNRFYDMTPKGRAMYEQGTSALAGGETRTVAYMKPYPLNAAKAKGVKIWDVDGNEFRDYLNNHTSMVHGHAHPYIEEKIIEALRKGTGVPAIMEEQIKLANVLCDRVPSVERIRFCNSGSEATMYAVRVARAYTGRDIVIKMDGGYHGTTDIMEFNTVPPQVEGSYNKVAIPDSNGVPVRIGEDMRFAPFNDLDVIEDILKKEADNVACILVEPIMGAAGFIKAKPGYLKGLRSLADQYSVLLVFDEVQSLRLSTGGVQKMEGVMPDLTAMAKIIGGGLPVGAVGGKKEYMDVFDSRKGPKLVQSGTFNGNRAVMAGGLAAMQLLDETAVTMINAKGDALAEKINKSIDKYKIPVSVSQLGSFLHIHFTEKIPTNYQETFNPYSHVFELFNLELLFRGVYAAPRGTWSLSTVMTDNDIELAAKAVDEAFFEIKPYFG